MGRLAQPQLLCRARFRQLYRPFSAFRPYIRFICRLDIVLYGIIRLGYGIDFRVAMISLHSSLSPQSRRSSIHLLQRASVASRNFAAIGGLAYSSHADLPAVNISSAAHALSFMRRELV